LNRGQATWAAAYLYLVYVFLGEIPAFANLPVFSLQAVSILLVVMYLVSSVVNWGAATAAKYLVGTFLVSYAVESVGVSTGLPFGHYVYTAALSPLIGPVPLFIPFLWCALGYFCLQATGVSIVAPAALMATLDLSFDPIFSRSLWQWSTTIGPLYFGVPALNFIGWFLTALLVFALFWFAVGRKGDRKGRVVLSGGSALGVGFYLVLGLTNVVSLLTGGIPQAAAVSLVLFVLASVVLWRERAEASSIPQ